MQSTNIRHQHSLQRQQNCLIFLFLFLGLLAFTPAQAQWISLGGGNGSYAKDAGKSLQGKRQRLYRPMAFGFYLAPVQSKFTPKFSDGFAQSPTAAANQVRNVFVKNTPGFAVGFYSNFRLSEFWDFRVHLGASFYEREIEYVLGSGETIQRIVEAPMVELPLLFKYRSRLRGIANMYMIGGIKPGFILSRRTEEEESVKIADTDLSLELGMGFDIFFPYFRFAPEIRFSRGLVNVLDDAEPNFFNQPLRRLTTNTFSLYVHFGG